MPLSLLTGVYVFFGGGRRSRESQTCCFPGTRDFEVTGNWKSEEKEKNHKEGDKDVSPQ